VLSLLHGLFYLSVRTVSAHNLKTEGTEQL